MTHTSTAELGRYVCVRAGRDGNDRVLMVVPARLRPPKWPRSIRLPQVGTRTGSLSDPRFRARVHADAQRLNRRLDLERALAFSAASADRSLARLADLYFSSAKYRQLSDSRKYRNRRSVLQILEWSSSRGNPKVTELVQGDVDEFLDRFELGSATRFDMRSVWNVLFWIAHRHRWIQESPLERGNWDTPVPAPVRIWQKDDVARYVAMSDLRGYPTLGVMIALMFETGQRCGDVRKLEWGRDYNGQWLNFKQSKTNKHVNIPIPEWLRQRIAAVRLDGSDFLFNHPRTGKGFSAAQLEYAFSDVRDSCAQDGEEKLLIRSLRHSCVCKLFSSGLPITEIAGITGHLLARVHTILERYFPDRAGAGANGMVRAFEADGHDPAAFGSLDAPKPKDWTEQSSRRKKYISPQLTERNFHRMIAAKTGQDASGLVRYPAQLFGRDAPLDSGPLIEETSSLP